MIAIDYWFTLIIFGDHCSHPEVSFFHFWSNIRKYWAMDQQHKVIPLLLLLFQVLLVASQTDSQDCKFNYTFFFNVLLTLVFDLYLPYILSHLMKRSKECFPIFLGLLLNMVRFSFVTLYFWVLHFYATQYIITKHKK